MPGMPRGPVGRTLPWRWLHRFALLPDMGALAALPAGVGEPKSEPPLRRMRRAEASRSDGLSCIVAGHVRLWVGASGAKGTRAKARRTGNVIARKKRVKA